MKKIISILVFSLAISSAFAAGAKKINPNVVENADGSVSITNADKDASIKTNQKYDGFKNVTVIDGAKVTKNNPVSFDLSDYGDKEILVSFSCDIKIVEPNDESLDLSWMINDFEAGMPVILREVINSNEWTKISGEKVVAIGKKKSFYLSGAGIPVSDSKIYIKDLNLTLTGENLSGKKVPEVKWTDAESLKEAYAEYFDHFGLACSYRGELQLSSVQDGLAHHVNSITMGNEFKPDFLFNWAKPSIMEDFVAEDGNTYKMPKGLPVFTTMDGCMQLARMMGVQIRGHVLVWHSQTPVWFFKKNFSNSDSAEFVDKDTMNARLEWYIKTVLEHVKEWETKYNNGNRIVYTWDVVNEAIADGASTTKWLREDSNWYRIYGDETFIVNAFRYATKYAPADVKLVYNDYGCYGPGKRYGVCKIIDTIKAVPDARIDAVGMQSHIGISSPAINIGDGNNTFEEAIKTFISHGVDVQITELDIGNKNPRYSPMLLKTRYKDVYKMFIRNRAKDGEHGITDVTIWGITDRNTWLNNQPEYKNNKQYPLLFTGDFTCKPAFYGVLEAAKQDK